jgi:recombinational DNA repair protein RecT
VNTRNAPTIFIASASCKHFLIITWRSVCEHCRNAFTIFIASASYKHFIRKCLYEIDAIKIVGAFLQCSQTDLQVIIRKCLYEADAIKIVGAFLQCSQTDLPVGMPLQSLQHQPHTNTS